MKTELKTFRTLLVLWFIAVLAARSAWAGGSGLNVIVVVNQNSTNSIQLGNAYCEARGVSPQNVFRMTGWTGGAITWSRADFETRLRNPLLNMVVARRLAQQAEFVLLSMDIPYRVVDGASQNSTTSALFYGFKTNTTSTVSGYPTCSLPDASSNSYSFSERPFGEAPPDTAPTNSFLAMMLTDTSLAGAERILQRSVTGDSSFPTQTVVLAKTSDTARNVRFVEFDNAILESQVRGSTSLVRMDTSSSSFTNLFGMMTGLATLSFPVNAFVAGAIGDSLTSHAGDILESSGQTSLLAFLNAGATASYGTVVEPCNYLAKFPNPMNYMYQHRGFSVAEAYYQSVRNPFQGLIVGEPLCAPFALRGQTDWNSLTNRSFIAGQASLGLTFFSAAANLPFGKVDLFIDGNYEQTVTNLPPFPGNRISVTIKGFTVNYTVPFNATVTGVAKGLAMALNGKSNSTRVAAEPVGDRIILRSLDATQPGNGVTLSANATRGSATRLTTMVTAAQPTFLDSAAQGFVRMTVRNTPLTGDWLQLHFVKTNGALVVAGITNNTTGTTIGALVQGLLNEVSSMPELQSAEGVTASDFQFFPSADAAQFTLYARSPGWLAAQTQVAITASPNLSTQPLGMNRLEDNLPDLQARNHLYVASGVTLLPVNFTLDTRGLPDGFHDLTAVAYEGTSVRTQTRVSRTVRIQNTALTGTITPPPGGTNATLEMPLQFTVTASSTSISHIELFTTGGCVGAVSNQASTVFTVAPGSLGLGLHPFYALITDGLGNRYRTETSWIRLIPAIDLTIGPPRTLSWNAIAGQNYELLATTNLAEAFEPVASVVASNAVGQWTIPEHEKATRFYRVRTTDH